MLGSTRVRGAKVGVYWETYGYAAGDSVDVAVIISRHEPISKVRRIGMFLRLAHDLNGQVAVRWGEPTPGHSSWTVPGVVPIQAAQHSAGLVAHRARSLHRTSSRR